MPIYSTISDIIISFSDLHSLNVLSPVLVTDDEHSEDLQLKTFLHLIIFFEIINVHYLIQKILSSLWKLTNILPK